MKSFSQVYGILRKKNQGQYALLAGCCFFSTLLITAYVLMMRSPTVLSVLPEGGDSRKQVMMIFALTVIGCGVFTAYASGLFFRYKSHESGVFLALGATKKQLACELAKELTLLAICSCGLGTLLGGPFSWGVWKIFRMLVVDSEEMALSFDTSAYGLALVFSIYTLSLLFGMMFVFLRRTNILDIIRESHKSESVRQVPRWQGSLGIVMVAVGVFIGYQAPGWIINGLKWYPPEWLTSIFYLPALVGLYWILIHTVVNGWGRKHKYKDLVTTSIMRFQGRQTVRNMLVVTVLIAGAYFASFYAPILGVGAYQAYDERSVDYAFHYRSDQSLPTQADIEAMAEEYGVSLTDYFEESAAVLAYDAYVHVEHEGKMGVTYTEEYERQASSCAYLSESAWNNLMKDNLDLKPGTVAAVYDDKGDGNGRMGNDISLITNPVTGAELSVTSVEPVLCSTALFGRRVMDDEDYAQMTTGLPDDWRENQVFFNVEKVYETYDFAKALFHKIVESSGPQVEIIDAWDPVEKMKAEAAGEPYAYDPGNEQMYGLDKVSYQQSDSSNFRLYWKYMPQFRALDKADFVRTMAVYLMLFIFIALLCFAAVAVILYTRCITIALTNKQVYHDLGHLGASNAFLRGTVKRQISRVFTVPIITGTAVISAFYTMILYFNDNGFSSGELSGMGVCCGIIVGISVLLYILYRYSFRSICIKLGISK